MFVLVVVLSVSQGKRNKVKLHLILILNLVLILSLALSLVVGLSLVLILIRDCNAVARRVSNNKRARVIIPSTPLLTDEYVYIEAKRMLERQ